MAEKLSIIVPVYKEGENIRTLLDGFAKRVRDIDFTVYLVYDFERDNTLTAVSKIKDRYRFGIRTVRNMYGTGALNAMKTGLRQARGKAILITMADNSDDPADIPRMYGLIAEGYDVVCASRYSGGGKSGNMSDMLLKKLISKYICLSLHYLTRMPTRDVSNNFKMYSRKAVEGVAIESSKGFELAMELTVKAYARGLRITEIPTIWRDRASGKSRFRLLGWAPGYLRWYAYALLHAHPKAG